MKTLADAYKELKGDLGNLEISTRGAKIILESTVSNSSWTKGEILADDENHSPDCFREVCTIEEFNNYKGEQVKTVIDAIKYYGGFNFVNSKHEHHHTHIVYSNLSNSPYSVYASDIGSNPVICTIKEFNQCVEEMSTNYGRCSTGMLRRWHNGLKDNKPVTPPTAQGYEIKGDGGDKPVYTKEFRVLGGQAEVWQKCKVVFTGKRYTIVENENGKEFSRKTAKIFIRDIDTRTDTEKAIDDIKPYSLMKVKEIEALLNLIKANQIHCVTFTGES